MNKKENVIEIRVTQGYDRLIRCVIFPFFFKRTSSHFCPAASSPFLIWVFFLFLHFLLNNVFVRSCSGVNIQHLVRAKEKQTPAPGKTASSLCLWRIDVEFSFCRGFFPPPYPHTIRIAALFLCQLFHL